jgi:hypothetical protein
LKVEAYGSAFRLNEDELEAAPLFTNGAIDTEHTTFADPFGGYEEAIHTLDAIIERYLRNPQIPESAIIGAYLRNPSVFEGAGAAVLPVVCEIHHIRFGQHCDCM